MVQQLLHHMDSDPVWTSSSSATVSESSTSLNEGQTLTITVNTTNVDDGLVLYWTVDQHTGSINTSDFSAYSGTVTITNGTGTITIDISADVTTEGEEKFAVSCPLPPLKFPPFEVFKNIKVSLNILPVKLFEPEPAV